MAGTVEVIDELMKALSTRDLDRAAGLYATDGVVVRYEGVATGHDEIRAFLVGLLSSYERFDLVSVDQVVHSGDTLVWDASVETGAGVLQMSNVVVLADSGLIVRHVPLVRGFWGKT